MFLFWSILLVLIGAFCVQGNWFIPSSVPPVVACWCIKGVCTRPWPSLCPSLDPRALTVNKTWVLDSFDACLGVYRVSGVHGLNVPLPLFPLRSFLPWGLLTDHGSTAANTVLWSSRHQQRSGKWNPLVEISLTPLFSRSSFLVPLRFHHHRRHHHNHATGQRR